MCSARGRVLRRASDSRCHSFGLHSPFTRSVGTGISAISRVLSFITKLLLKNSLLDEFTTACFNHARAMPAKALLPSVLFPKYRIASTVAIVLLRVDAYLTTGIQKRWSDICLILRTMKKYAGTKFASKCCRLAAVQLILGGRNIDRETCETE